MWVRILAKELRSHMPAAGQLSLHATTREPTGCNCWACAAKKKKSCNNNYNILYHYIERNIRYNRPPSKPDPDIGDAILISSLLPQSSPEGFLDFPVKKKVWLEIEGSQSHDCLLGSIVRLTPHDILRQSVVYHDLAVPGPTCLWNPEESLSIFMRQKIYPSPEKTWI